MVGKVTLQSPPDTISAALPFLDRRAQDAPGHWLLASLGKKVLRPGGRALTERMLAALQVTDRDVVELAPGLGLTAGMLPDRQPVSCAGVEQDRTASALSSAALGGRGRIVNGSAQQTGGVVHGRGRRHQPAAPSLSSPHAPRELHLFNCYGKKQQRVRLACRPMQ